MKRIIQEVAIFKEKLLTLNEIILTAGSLCGVISVQVFLYLTNINQFLIPKLVSEYDNVAKIQQIIFYSYFYTKSHDVNLRNV